jgi:hydroxymethylpyrimidine pyrophosphatase-like HAD family hydrolase
MLKIIIFTPILFFICLDTARSKDIFQLYSNGHLMSSQSALKGLSFHPSDPFILSMIIKNTSDIPVQEHIEEKTLYRHMMDFMTTLTVPENHFWVNLSPYEQNRIISPALRQTQVGQDLLTSDAQLKQLTAMLMSPKSKTGEHFWTHIYTFAYENNIKTNVSLDMHNKIWITPDTAMIRSDSQNVIIDHANLKVMLEKDFMATHLTTNHQDEHSMTVATESEFSQQMFNSMKNMILPIVSESVNNDKSFARLREIYQAMILASWYKENMRKSFLGKTFVDQKQIPSFLHTENDIIDQVYKTYVQNFSNQTYHSIVETYNPKTQTMETHQFVSGGIQMSQISTSSQVSSMSVLMNELFANTSPDYTFGPITDGVQLYWRSVPHNRLTHAHTFAGVNSISTFTIEHRLLTKNHIIFDYDDTLSAHETRITLEMVEELNALLDQGKKISILSASSLKKLSQHFDGIELNGEITIYTREGGSAFTRKKTGEIVLDPNLSNPFPADSVENIKAFMNRFFLEQNFQETAQWSLDPGGAELGLVISTENSNHLPITARHIQKRLESLNFKYPFRMKYNAKKKQLRIGFIASSKKDTLNKYARVNNISITDIAYFDDNFDASGTGYSTRELSGITLINVRNYLDTYQILKTINEQSNTQILTVIETPHTLTKNETISRLKEIPYEQIYSRFAISETDILEKFANAIALSIAETNTFRNNLNQVTILIENINSLTSPQTRLAQRVAELLHAKTLKVDIDTERLTEPSEMIAHPENLTNHTIFWIQSNILNTESFAHIEQLLTQYNPQNINAFNIWNLINITPDLETLNNLTLSKEILASPIEDITNAIQSAQGRINIELLSLFISLSTDELKLVFSNLSIEDAISVYIHLLRFYPDSQTLKHIIPLLKQQYTLTIPPMVAINPENLLKAYQVIDKGYIKSYSPLNTLDFLNQVLLELNNVGGIHLDTSVLEIKANILGLNYPIWSPDPASNTVIQHLTPSLESNIQVDNQLIIINFRLNHIFN